MIEEIFQNHAVGGFQQHLSYDTPRQVQRSRQIDVEHLIDFCIRHGRQNAIAGDSRTVDQTERASKTLDCLADELFGLLGVAHVGRCKEKRFVAAQTVGKSGRRAAKSADLVASSK